MKKEWLQSQHGYAIPCHTVWNGASKVLIVCHGFGSSKESPMVQALNETMPKHGIGVVSFDFPAHGESPADQEGLRLPYCLDDLATVERYVREMAPQAEVGYFGSSFGAYVTLLYISLYDHTGKKAFLRSSAVSMPALVESWVDDRAKEDLCRQGYFVPDYDYVREIRLTPAFLEDLRTHDIFQIFRKDGTQLCMIHGAKDSVAPPAAAKAFAEQMGARLIVMPNGEHNLMGEGELEQVLSHAAAFFQSGDR